MRYGPFLKLFPNSKLQKPTGIWDCRDILSEDKFYLKGQCCWLRGHRIFELCDRISSRKRKVTETFLPVLMGACSNPLSQKLSKFSWHCPSWSNYYFSFFLKNLELRENTWGALAETMHSVLFLLVMCALGPSGGTNNNK